MSKKTKPNIDHQRLLHAWQTTLPDTLKETDSVVIKTNEDQPDVLRIHIITAGRSNYEFDFTCEYVDSREVRVEFVDVQKGGQSVDEQTDNIQNMIEDYVRDIHECAQALHAVTHG